MDLHSAIRQVLPLKDIERLLAANPAAALVADVHQKLALHLAAEQGRAEVVKALLTAAPATAAATDRDLWTPLHWAAFGGHQDAVSLLLAAEPGAAMMGNCGSSTPLHLAACYGHERVVQALVAAAPGAAAMRSNSGKTPLQTAVVHRRIAAAHHLLLGPTSDLLKALAIDCDKAQPLYADLAASRRMTRWQWRKLRRVCPPLAAALHAVLERSPAEARLLVQRLAARQRQRLRTFALCLVRAQRKARASLPAEVTGRILAMAGSMLAHI